MSVQKDHIDNLPTDKNPPSDIEVQLIESLFKEKTEGINRLLSSTKDILIAGILFIVLSFKNVDDLVMKFFPSSTNSQYILLGIKVIIFMIVLFVIKNLYLVQK